MSEYAPRHDQHKPLEHQAHRHSEVHEKPIHEQQQAHQEALAEKHRTLEQAREVSRQQAESAHSHEHLIHAHESAPPEHHYLTKHMRDAAYKNVLLDAQRYLSKSQRSFSKLIHQNTIESISDFASHTVARPAAIAGGGAVGVFAGSVLYFLMRWYGYELRPSVLIVLFLLGYMCGLFAEATVRIFKSISHRRHL